MFSLRSAARGHFGTICRSASLLAQGLSLVIFHHVQPIAAKVYNGLCAAEGITYPVGPTHEGLGITMIAVAVPLLLARSNVLIVVNLITSFITVFGAGTLLSTAGDTPYECFTSSGTYEDHYLWTRGIRLLARCRGLLLLRFPAARPDRLGDHEGGCIPQSFADGAVNLAA
jgi:hypothetical protein